MPQRKPAAAPTPSASRTLSTPQEFIDTARTDPAFGRVYERFATAGVLNWLTEDEKALHFGVAAYAAGGGVVVELGTFEGGAAMFLAGGSARRGIGRVVCVDPHFGAPPWLGMAPKQRTLEKFKRHARICGVDSQIDVRVGDSAAVAAVWPAEPIDVVFIDADHSYLGALKDFECWTTKVRPGGLIMIDDADDHALPELLELIAELKHLTGVTFIGQVDGVALFRRGTSSAAQLLDEVRQMTLRRGVHRPWDLTGIHALGLPKAFGRSLPGERAPGQADAYQLAFLARCGEGSYGYTRNAGDLAAEVIGAVCTDRGTGPAIDLTPDVTATCRAVFCTIDEMTTYTRLLPPGGVMLVLNPTPEDTDSALRVRQKMLDAGLEGCGWGGAYHWGVWQPFDISSDAVIRNTVKASNAG